jgi:integrase
MTLYELIEQALACQQMRADGSLAPVLARSRRAPMRSAVKRYGTFLDIDPETAPPERYHRPDHEIKALVDAKAPDSLAANTRRNLANDVISLLRIGVEQGWLAPLPPPLLSWRQRRPDPKRLGAHARPSSYFLPLHHCPPALREALQSYLAWCEAPIARNRSRRIVKRPVSNDRTRRTILRLAGFAVRELGYAVEALTLESVCHPDVLEAYANWWLTRHGRVTGGLIEVLRMVQAITHHWLKDDESTQALQQMRQSLPPVEAVREKSAHWLSLQQLEEVGLSLHPLNDRRRQEFPNMRYPYRARQIRTSRTMSLYVEFSLIIRLLIRLPMRQRCIREMQLGRNLYQDHAGVWHIRFVGTELKIARAHGAIKRYEFPFPPDLVPALESWLQDWRPNLGAPESPLVFLTQRGQPFNASRMGDMISRLTYRFTGVSVNPHMIRDIFATEYLNAHPGDVMGCARLLGNTPEMVMQTYAHLLVKDADARMEAFLQSTFGNGNGKGKSH